MNRTDNKMTATLDARQQKYGGMDTPAGSVTDIKGFSMVREQVLGLKLDKMSDSVTGQTVVDPKGFLTDLNSMKINSQVRAFRVASVHVTASGALWRWCG
jgi:pre-mRNA-processing factor 6